MTTLAATGPAPDPGEAELLRRHRGLVQIVALLWVYALYDELRTHVTRSAAVASQHARQVLGAERAVGLNFEHTIQSAALHLPWLVAICNLSYSSLHLLVPPIVLVLLYRRAPERYPHWRNVFVIMLGLALLGFWLFPLMPPRLVSGPGHLVDTSAHYLSLSKLPVERLVSSTASSGPSLTGVTNPFAAMPSLHVGWSVWAVAALWAMVRRRRRRLALLLYPALMVLAVIVTANHWVFDAVAGAMLVGIAQGLALAAETWTANLKAMRTASAPA